MNQFYIISHFWLAGPGGGLSRGVKASAAMCQALFQTQQGAEVLSSTVLAIALNF